MMKKSFCSISLLLILISAPSLLMAQNRPLKIAFLGNSITYGDGLEHKNTESYPAVFNALLKHYLGDSSVDVRNFAVSARTMLRQGDHPLWNEQKFDSAINFIPDIIVVALGTNDTKPHNWDSVGIEFQNDYEAMIDTFACINPTLKSFVCYPPPAFKTNWGIRDSVIVHGVIPVVDSILLKKESYLIDFHSELKNCSYFFPDAIHPNTAGSVLMGKIVFDAFIKSKVLTPFKK